MDYMLVIFIGIVVGLVAGLALLIYLPARSLSKRLKQNKQLLEDFSNNLDHEEQQVTLFMRQLEEYERLGRGF